MSAYKACDKKGVANEVRVYCQDKKCNRVHILQAFIGYITYNFNCKLGVQDAIYWYGRIIK